MSTTTENGLHYSFSNILLGLLCGATLRAVISLHSHSGQNSPPMYGDYEAHRHWMEITVNTPVHSWYKNTTNNDLQYWGLDYPPLAAYHSLITGLTARYVNNSYVALHESRGLESSSHKVFMRSTALFPDLILFFPAIIYYLAATGMKLRHCYVYFNDYLLLCLLYPGFILVDHGHFQYNSIPLGLTIISICLLFNGKYCRSSIAFCLAINYKQMSLYHSLPFFVFILQKIIRQPTIPSKLRLLIRVSLTVLATFVITWLPFILFNEVYSVVNRIFPVARGVFEDKVANTWCAVNVLIKLKNVIPPNVMLRICALSTLVVSAPSLIYLARRPSQKQFLLSLINVSLAFFLFSFQVHEKSILLVALPVMLYAPYDIIPCAWFLVASNISLLHLAIKDNLIICYIILTGVFQVYMMYSGGVFERCRRDRRFKYIALSNIGGLVLLLCFVFVKPPVRYPDIWPLMNALYSCAHFVGFLVYFNYEQFVDKGINVYRY